MPRIIVITGTSTDCGKTVLTSLLGRHLVGAHRVAALKPICSGGRDDARALRKACDNVLTLDQVNPWHFRAALAPLLAARQEGRLVSLRDVVAHVRVVAHDFEVLLVEGAGGVLSPLGEHFSTRELIAALGADVMIVARNELGVVNHVRLTVESLTPLLRMRARICLMMPARPSVASKTNAALLSEFLPPEHIVELPWLEDVRSISNAPLSRLLTEKLSEMLHG